MSSEVKGKLVREKVIEIMKSEGVSPEFIILEDEEYKAELNKKLLEEVNEYLKDETVEDLGDIVEVVLAILKINRLNLGDLMEVIDEKREEKGGFEKKIFLKD